MTKRFPKWRESKIDLSKLHLQQINQYKIISYPPAGNDVFECIGALNTGKKINFVLKSERGSFANFDNEIKILNTLNDFPIPKVIETGKINDFRYIVMSKMNGEKLSDIFKTNKKVDKARYLFLYGKALAQIHNLNLKWDKARQRDVNDVPNTQLYKDLDNYESEIIEYLKDTKPNIIMDTFIHGDFHYGNILWQDYQISAILDWEYSGLGFKEQDIAWALVLRPEQQFMDKLEDYKIFLKGYSSVNTFDSSKLKWCLINGLMHFYLMNKNTKNSSYLTKLKSLIEKLKEYNFEKNFYKR